MEGTIKEYIKYMETKYKYQLDFFMLISFWVLLHSVFAGLMENSFCYFSLLGIAAACIGGLVYKIMKKHQLDLFCMFGFAFPMIFIIGVILMPCTDFIVFLFSCLLVCSMSISMYCCKEEDAKAIAILHVIYMFSCNLVMPCIGTSI